MESFHHYYDLAREFFHPQTGFPTCRFPVLVSGKYTKTLSAMNLEVFNLYIEMYTYIQHHNLSEGSPVPSAQAIADYKNAQTPNEEGDAEGSAADAGNSTSAAPTSTWESRKDLWLHALQVYARKKIMVPPVVSVIRWVIQPLGSGDLLVRDIRVPYRLLRNRSSRTPFLYAYCHMSAIKDEASFVKSRECQTTKKCQKETIGTFHPCTCSLRLRGEHAHFHAMQAVEQAPASTMKWSEGLPMSSIIRITLSSTHTVR